MMYYFPQGLKSLLQDGTHHPDSVDFLRLLDNYQRCNAALRFHFSMGDGAENKRPDRGIIPPDSCTGFEPSPARLVSPIMAFFPNPSKGLQEMKTLTPIQTKIRFIFSFSPFLIAPTAKKGYSIAKHETKCLGFDSLVNSHGAKHRLSSLAVFFCAKLARLYSLWAGASADAFMRAGNRVSQSVNPLVTRPPYLTVGSGVIQHFTRRTQAPQIYLPTTF